MQIKQPERRGSYSKELRGEFGGGFGQDLMKEFKVLGCKDYHSAAIGGAISFVIWTR